jgi:hypothetical protein
VSAAILLLRAGLALLRTELGRRLGTVAVLAAVMVAGVSALYDHADPVTAALPAEAAAAVATTRPAPSAPKPAPKPNPKPAAAKPRRPEQVAAAWYARRRGIAPGQVQALQSQPLSGGRVRVLVMGRVGRDRLDTAVVIVRRAGSRWVVR